MNHVQDPWRLQLPTLFRALADPKVTLPSPQNDSLDRACESWGALNFALHSLLGWNDVGRGLAWWYRAGRPMDDSPVLALVGQVWGRNDLIDYYAAWAWKPADAGWKLPQEADPMNGPSPTWLAKHSRWPDEDWWRCFVRRGCVHHHDPFYGGTDSLHLSVHTRREDQERSPTVVLPLVSDEGRAILVTEGLDHWLADLEAAGDQLPSRGDRSWRVDVFDRQVGWLGEFRRSRVSGRWFTGKHHIHMQGMKA